MSELIKVKVFPESKSQKIEEERGRFLVFVKSKARGGEANNETLELLSKHLNIPREKFLIIKGQQTPTKIIKIHN